MVVVHTPSSKGRPAAATPAAEQFIDSPDGSIVPDDIDDDAADRRDGTSWLETYRHVALVDNYALNWLLTLSRLDIY